jgi:hypothetical protein
MRFKRAEILVLSLGLVSSVGTASRAEDKGEGGEEKKKTQHPDAVEWYKRTQKVAALESKIKDDTKNLEALIKAKNSGTRLVKGDKGETDILKQIVKTHAQLLETYKKFEDEKRDVRYRYPGEGDLVEREYMSSRPPTLEQVERQLGLGGELTRLSAQIEQKYKTFNPPEPRSPRREDGPESTVRKKSSDNDQGENQEAEKPKLKLVK